MVYIFLSIIFAIIPSTVWFSYWWIKDNQKEPPRPIAMAIFLGIVSAFLLYPFRFSFINFPWLFVIFLAAFLEEFLKGGSEIITAERYYKAFDQVIDGIIYAISVGMGFTLVENAIYFYESLSESGFSLLFMNTFILRSFFTTYAHSVFTGVFGFAFMNAYLLPDEFISSKYHVLPFRTSDKHSSWKRFLKEIWHVLSLHILSYHLLKNKPINTNEHTPNQLILEGFLSAIYLHFLFNVLVKLEIGGKSLSILVPGLLLLSGTALAKKFAFQKYREIIHRKHSPLHTLVLVKKTVKENKKRIMRLVSK